MLFFMQCNKNIFINQVNNYILDKEKVIYVMLSQSEILNSHFKVVGDQLIRIQQQYLDELLKLRNAETNPTKNEQTLRVSIKQEHYGLVRQYALDNIKTSFN
jgi:hypothetical protein